MRAAWRISLDIITSPLRSRSRMGFYIRTEGLLDVLTCLIENKVFEDAIADSFKLVRCSKSLAGSFNVSFPRRCGSWRHRV
jgi:hypothetical protein